MSKGNKIILWILGIGLVVTIIYFVYKYYGFPDVIKKTADPNNPNGMLFTDYGDVVDVNKPILYGVKSNSATRLQSEINNVITRCGYNYTLLSIDGDPRTKTRDALLFISGNALDLGTVTISNVMALQCSSPGSVTLPPPTTVIVPLGTAPTYSGGNRIIQEDTNPFSIYKN